MECNSLRSWENYCRTCMNGDEEDSKEIINYKKEIVGKTCKIVSIFNEPENKEHINMTIMELLMQTIPQLTVDSSDTLPKTLCENCIERLINAYRFQKMCIRVEQKFREMLKENHTDSQKNKDPLKDVCTDNVGVVEIAYILKPILKFEVDENVEICTTNVEDTEFVKFDIEDNVVGALSDSETTANEDGSSDWVIPPNKMRKKSVMGLNGEEKQTPSELTCHSTKDSKNTINHKSEFGKNFKCDECESCLSTSRSLKRHKLIHLREMGVIGKNTIDNCKDSGSKIFKCDECGDGLSTLKSLKRHKRIHIKTLVTARLSTLVKKNYECEFCHKVLRKPSTLRDHLRKHTGDEPYLCSECGKTFANTSNLKQHLLRHGTERSYSCPDCPKTFRGSSDLSAHKSVHKNIKSHVCDICGAAFARPFILKKHKIYHTGVRNYKCDYCDMRFFLADHCRRHMRIHSGEKPYKCKYCQSEYGQSTELMKHLRAHLGVNVYKCDLCPQRFRMERELRAHFYTHKNDDEETKARNLQALKDEEHKLQIKYGLTKCT